MTISRKISLKFFLIYALVTLLILSTLWAIYVHTPEATCYYAYSITFIALLIALLRGGLGTYTFWITFTAGYPILVPYIVQDLLGYSRISGHAPSFQTPEIMAIPLLIGAISSLILSFFVSSRPIMPNNSSWGLSSNPATLKLWLLICIGSMVFFAWLTEPGMPIGIASYDTLRNQRITGTNFAGGAWAVFAVLALALYLKLQANRSTKISRALQLVFWAGVVLSLLWLLIHARRSEIAGFFMLLMCTLGYRISLRKKILFGVAVFIPLAIVSYVRSIPFLEGSFSTTSITSHMWLQLPGAPGNVLISWITAYHLKVSNALNLYPGQSYVAHLINLPPRFLDLPRAKSAYDYVDNIVPLIGGNPYLLEPFVSFGLLGILCCLAVFILMTNWSVNTFRKYLAGKVGTVRFLIAANFLVIIFRTLWYGLDALLTGFVIALLVSLTLVIHYHATYRGIGHKLKYVYPTQRES